MTFNTEECTLDNWGPEWRRISDGKFLPIGDRRALVARKDYERTAPKKCRAWRDGFSITCNSTYELAAFLKRDCPSVTNAIKKNQNVGSKRDGFMYRVERVI